MRRLDRRVVPYDRLPAEQRWLAGASAAAVAGHEARLHLPGGRCERDASAGTLVFDVQAALTVTLEREGEEGLALAIEFDMNAGRNHFDLVVDGRLVVSFSTPQVVARRRRFGFALAPHDGLVTVALVKRTEAGAVQLWPYRTTHPVVLHAVRLAGWRLVAPIPPTLRIEAVGDSDVAGYGNEGAPTRLDLRGLIRAGLATQNASNAWPHVLARMLGAEVSVVAQSGIGVATNAISNAFGPRLGELYSRAVLSRHGSVHPYDAGEGSANWAPHAVLLEVGANDLYGGRAPPTHKAFVAAYVALLKQVRSFRPPPAQLVALVAVMATPTYQYAARDDAGKLGRFIKAAVDEYVAQTGDALACCVAPAAVMVWPDDGGSIEHWSVSGMLKYAEAVCDALERLPPPPSSGAGAGAGWRRVRLRPEALQLALPAETCEARVV